MMNLINQSEFVMKTNEKHFGGIYINKMMRSDENADAFGCVEQQAKTLE